MAWQRPGPWIGEDVELVGPDGTARDAVVVDVPRARVAHLVAEIDGDLSYLPSIHHGSEPGHWRWPDEREARP